MTVLYNILTYLTFIGSSFFSNLFGTGAKASFDRGSGLSVNEER